MIIINRAIYFNKWLLFFLVITIGVLSCTKSPEESNKQVPVIGNQQFSLSPEQIREFKSLANKGDADAAYRLANYYDFLTEDYRQALAWRKKAAENGHSTAQLEIGKCYIYGDRCQRNINKARYWLKKADANNEYNAKIYLTFMISADEVKMNKEKAENGDGDAAYLLYNYYYYIKGDSRTAKIWLKTAKDFGHPTPYPFEDPDGKYGQPERK